MTTDVIGRLLSAALDSLDADLRKPPLAMNAPHPDDLAVDQFAAALKAKLARKRPEKGAACRAIRPAGAFAMMLQLREGGADAIRREFVPPAGETTVSPGIDKRIVAARLPDTLAHRLADQLDQQLRRPSIKSDLALSNVMLCARDYLRQEPAESQW